jgi:hypothetical protein
MFGGHWKNKDPRLGRLRIRRTDGAGQTTDWSHTIRRGGRQKSPHWDKRSAGRFRREDVYPCNEGFPAVSHIGPVSGGMPILFNLILADGRRVRGIVSTTRQIDGQPAWRVDTPQGAILVSYYEVAGWSSL